MGDVMAKTTRSAADFVGSILEGMEQEAPATVAPRKSDSRIPIVREMEAAAEGAFDELAKLRRQIEEDKANGRVIVELDPSRIRRARYTDRDPSFVEDAAFEQLCRSIKDGGQLMPVGVRATTEEGWDYETVWGHRRIAACKALGRPVRAVVLQHDDVRAAVLGYSENTRRQGTSLIEQGRFFTALISQGLFAHQRDLAQGLEVSDAQVSTAVRVAEIPDDILEAIGDWRRCTGRQALALRKAMDEPEGLELMRAQAESVRRSSGTLKSRITQLCAAVHRAPKTPVRRTHTDPKGRHYATIEADRFGVTCRFPKTTEPDFVEFIWERLPALRAEYEKNSRGDGE